MASKTSLVDSRAENCPSLSLPSPAGGHAHSTPDEGSQPQASLANGLKERRMRMRPGAGSAD